MWPDKSNMHPYSMWCVTAQSTRLNKVITIMMDKKVEESKARSER